MPRTLAELDAHLDHVRAAPRERGTVELIVRRPARLEREVIEEAELDTVHGLVGDSWIARPSKRTPDGSPNIGQQLTLMSSRAIVALTEPGDHARWALAGDQLFVDFALAEAHLPPGTRLAIGGAVIEISAVPHTGCAKFTERFGSDATKWVNSDAGIALHLRGVNARVLASGTVRRGDAITRVP